MKERVFGFVRWNNKPHYAPLATFGLHEVYESTGRLVCVDPPKADANLTNKEEIRGNIALVERGGCTFPDKAKRVQAAGAIAMIVANYEVNSPSTAFTMGEIEVGEAEEVTIPCVMLSFENVRSLLIYAHTTENAAVLIQLLGTAKASVAQQQEKMSRMKPTLSKPTTFLSDVNTVWSKFVESGLIKKASPLEEKVEDQKPDEIVEEFVADEPRAQFAFIRWSDSADCYRMNYAPLASFSKEQANIQHQIITAKLVQCDPPLADSEVVRNAAQLRGNIAFVERGKCTFPEKLERVQRAGAVAAIIANNDQQDPDAAFVMSVDHLNAEHIVIPSVMISYNVAQLLRQSRPKDLSLVCVGGETADLVLGHGCEKFHLTTPPAPIKYTRGQSPLLSSCREGEVDIVRQLILHKERVFVQNGWKMTPLHTACISGRGEIVTMILQAAKETLQFQNTFKTIEEFVNLRDLGGQTALHYACLAGRTECCEILIAAHANVSLRNEGGCTALHFACRSGKTDCIEILISANASLDSEGKYQFNGVDDIDLDGNTPLYYACQEGHSECALYLIAANANLNHVNQAGSTALHQICLAANASGKTHGAMQVIKRMLVERVEVIADSSGHLPMDLLSNKTYRREVEVMYLREQVERHKVKLHEYEEKSQTLEKTVAEYVAEHITSQFLLKEAAKEREEMNVQLQTQRVHIQQMQIQMKSFVQYLQTAQNESGSSIVHRTSSNTMVGLDSEDLAIGSKRDYEREAELAEEAALCRDIAKKYARNRNYHKAIEYFRKSLSLLPLPGVQRLLDKVFELQAVLDKAKASEEAARRKAESIADLMKRYRRLLHESGAPDSAVEAIEKEIYLLSTLEDGSPEFIMARDWLDWLVSLPWDLSGTHAFGMDMFRKLRDVETEEQNQKRDQAARVIQRGVREYLSVFLFERDLAACRIQSFYRQFHRCYALANTSIDTSSTDSIDQDDEISNPAEEPEENEKIRELAADQFDEYVDTFIPKRMARNEEICVLSGVKLIQPPTLDDECPDPKEKFHILQCLKADHDEYYVWNRWGYTGEQSQTALKGPYDESTEAMDEFSRKYREKTQNEWGLGREEFVPTTKSFIPLAFSTPLNNNNVI